VAAEETIEEYEVLTEKYQIAHIDVYVAERRILAYAGPAPFLCAG